MKVLVVGSGGREHALGWALARSPSVSQLESAPGNPGLARLGRIRPVAAEDLDGQVRLFREERYHLVVVGPEQPLALGLADRLRAEGAAVFGPGAGGARLESSKAFAKGFMARHGIPTAAFRVVESLGEARALLAEWGPPIVVKASGLAGGKGVVVAETAAEALEACVGCLESRAFGAAGSTVILEKKLEGEEISLFTVTDGRSYHVLPGSQDHKRAFDGDRGPNTGGMGAYSPAPILDEALLARVKREIIEPTLSGLVAEGVDYRGLLYLGLMVTARGPELLEYNVRFGDPETQAVLPRLGLDLGELLLGAATATLRAEGLEPPAIPASACVVAVAGEYPRSGSRGAVIRGVEEAEARGALVFHAGTAEQDGALVTAGGRVLNVVGTGDTLALAVERAYASLEAIGFEGMRFRRDIGRRALTRGAHSAH
jgi:phosphoribosylamine--glycine ligase